MPEDLQQYFAAEARELIEGLMAGVLEAERAGALAPEGRRRLLRLAHTLKGAARVVRATAIGDAAHEMEDLIAAVGERFEPAQSSRLLSLIDTVTAALPISQERPVPAAAVTLTGAPALEDTVRAVRVELTDIETALDRVASLAAQCGVLNDELSRTGTPHATATADRVATQLAELRTHLHQMRLAPASSVFLAVERAVRDAAQAMGVMVRFTATGGEHRLDADVLGAVRDALIQLARNAVAHGIDRPAERAAKGKTPEGLISLQVERRGPDVTFAMADDGRGLDLDGLRAAAARAGHRGPLGERQLVDLLLSGGLTTRPAATQIAGRGVGLDLVRSIVSRLHGGITLANIAGHGVEVALRLPVSLRSLRYLRLESGDVAALLPLEAIRRTLRLADAALGVLGGQTHVTIDGAAVPLLTVDDVLTGGTNLDARVAVVLATGDGLVALAGQQFGETAETIAQALPPLSGAADMIRGLVLDADGRILPVLEPSALAGRTSSVAPARPSDRGRRILVIDDSVTTRMLERSILEAAGFAVDVAASAEEALICAASAPYDLFIVDVEMPGMNGFEFVAATRQDDALARTPAILVTSRSSDEDRHRGAEAGARGYIVKGEFDQDTFLGLVRRLVA